MLVPASAPVCVDSEYGTLKEVIVGLPYGKTPERDCPWLQETLKVLPEEENRELIAVLEERETTVHPVYFDTHNGPGGSTRCATQPLKRASAK